MHCAPNKRARKGPAVLAKAFWGSPQLRYLRDE
jgi:hypothetical protein